MSAAGMASCSGRAPPRRAAAAAAPRPRPRRGAAAVARATRDRVLRYPDGVVRYIRYPVAETQDEDAGGGGGAMLEIESLDDAAAAWDVATYPGSTRARKAAADAKKAGGGGAAPAAPGPQLPAREGGGGGGGEPTEPAGPSMSETVAYLDSLFGSSYAAAQPKIDIEHCYQVLDGCPWLVPRPVYVLTLGELRPGSPLAAPAAPAVAPDAASAGGGGGGEGLVGSTYTLRTKVVQEGASSALAELLGRPHLASALEVAHMRDGVVTFECCDAAARFATRMEEEGETQVTVAEVDSHRLFRLASDAAALVVLVAEGAGGELPAPFQLAAALKKQRAWDNL
ncbi:MAG: hypothetical protein J3K34DRAFT_458749 [Monoraphidium minutum]|nr:MAG: hypothetical protein J3K34DRAFT_458749 [Monoraphidium minutum]